MTAAALWVATHLIYTEILLVFIDLGPVQCDGFHGPLAACGVDIVTALGFRRCQLVCASVLMCLRFSRANPGFKVRGGAMASPGLIRIFKIHYNIYFKYDIFQIRFFITILYILLWKIVFDFFFFFFFFGGGGGCTPSKSALDLEDNFVSWRLAIL